MSTTCPSAAVSGAAARRYDERDQIIAQLLQRVDQLTEQLGLARTDQLTWLPTRDHWYRIAEDAWPSAHGLLLIDLDDVKAVNDTHGHAVVDAALAAVGERLRTMLTGDPLTGCGGRIGGDEFAVLVTRRPECGWQLQQVHGQLIDGLPIGASIGAVLDDQLTGTHRDGAMRGADRAMYRAKRSGGGVRMYAPEHDGPLAVPDHHPVQRPRHASPRRSGAPAREDTTRLGHKEELRVR